MSDTSGAVAYISAAAVVLAAVVSSAAAYITKIRADRRIEEFKVRAAEAERANSAKLNYEFKARTRMYEQFEPLLFQAQLSAGELRQRISGIIQLRGEAGEGVAALKSDYYIKNTLFRILRFQKLASAAINLQTLYDIRIEPETCKRFVILLAADDTLPHHVEIARMKSLSGEISSAASLSAQPFGLTRGDQEVLSAVLKNPVSEAKPVWHEFESALSAECTRSPVFASAYDKFHGVMCSDVVAVQAYFLRSLLTLYVHCVFLAEGRLVSLYGCRLELEADLEAISGRKINLDALGSMVDELSLAHKFANKLIQRKLRLVGLLNSGNPFKSLDVDP